MSIPFHIVKALEPYGRLIQMRGKLPHFKKLFVFILPLILMSSVTVYLSSVSAPSAFITVPEDYPTIQAAINSAPPGDTIFLRSGTYFENVVVDKSLSIIGEDKSTTIIDASGTSISAITIEYVSDITIANITIKGAANEGRYEDAGIYMNNINHCNITNNLISGKVTGVLVTTVAEGTQSIIEKNHIENCQIGVYVSNSSAIYIHENLVANSEQIGILLHQNSCGNTVSQNNVTNSGQGISLQFDSDFNTISGNDVLNNEIGFLCYNSNNNTIFGNNFIDNSFQVGSWGAFGVHRWNNGTIGNYWSDYNGMDNDSDGIGDTPFVMDENNQDSRPLIRPYLSDSTVEEVSNPASDSSTIPEDSELPWPILIVFIALGVTIAVVATWRIRRKQTMSKTLSIEQ